MKLRELGMPYDKIAKKLNKPIGTIRSRLNRARKCLMTRFFPDSRVRIISLKKALQ
jgi:DNA-directed RNA polymerase specialized sigma24 family protein